LIDKSLLSRSDLVPGHGAQRRGWEERSHAQHREHGEHRTFPAVSPVAGWKPAGFLGLTLALLALFEPVTVAVHFQDVNVVGQPVEQRAGQPLGPEHAGPLVEW
jgi:hypothetical protein